MLGKVLFLLLLMLDCSLCLCPDSYSPTPDGKHCMNMSENALVTRNNAQQMCQNENAYLAVIKDAFMNNYVYSSIKNGVFPIWIGAKCYSSVPSSCYWDADSSTMNYHNFGAGEPFPERGNCIFMSIDPDRRGQWYSDDCDARRYYYACEKSVAENPTNYKIQGHYYDVTADDVLGIEKSRKDFLPQERKIASWLSSILDTDYVDFYVEYFEIHGAAAGFPTAIYFGYLTTNGITKRNDLIKNLELPPTTSVYLVMPVYSVPPPPPLTGNNINNLNSNASCQNFGIFNGYNCSCSAECYDSQCQPEKCAGNKTGLKPVSQSMILVVSLRSSISSDIQTLIDAVPYLLHQLKATINGFTNYIITTFRQRSDVFYMSTEVFFNQTDLLNYMNGLVVGDANADQPVLSAAVAVQAYAPQMNIYSNILVLTDGRASDATSEDLHYPPRNNETYLIAQTLQWRNRITFLLTQTSDAPIDISGDGFDVYRRVSRAVQGDLLMLDKKELNSTLYNIVSYFSNVQVLNASYGMTSNFTFDLHPYYHDYKSCTILVSVESGQRLPNVTFPGAYVSDLSPTFNNSQFIMFAVRGKDVSSLEIIPYSGPYNVLISTQGDNDLVWITFVDDPSIDGGYSFAFSEKQMAASGAETYYGSIGLDFYTAPINWENGTISRTFYGIGRCLSNCDFCWTFENVDACKPGPFNIITTVTESSSCSMQPCYIYVIITVPGFCFIRDSDSDGKNENHIF